MAMGKRNRERQCGMWVATAELARGPGHPFYTRLNQVLARAGFDDFAERLCEKFYADGVGRPGIAPGVYFRMHLIGYFEGIDSERGIAWRCADSLGLRAFLGLELTDRAPDHSTLSVIRTRIDVQTHQQVFDWVLGVLRDDGLVSGKTVGLDATTLEANAALRSIVRRDTGESYQQFLERLARASGIDTPTREDLARLDKGRKNKGSNDDWTHPHDPDAKIARMKDGRTHLAHKAEHAVDMDTGATLAVTVQGADLGDTATMGKTLSETMETLAELRTDAAGRPLVIEEAVADKGYHSAQTAVDLERMSIRGYISEPKRKRRRWRGRAGGREQRAVYANRRRIRGERGKRLLRKRGELLERPFAHHYRTGAMRRTHLRGHANIIKRLLVHSAGCNLGLLMRKRFGIGKPRVLQGRAGTLARTLDALAQGLGRLAVLLQRVLLPDRGVPTITIPRFISTPFAV